MSTNTKETAVQLALRPYATAGVAIVGAGLIAVTPVATKLPDIQSLREVALSSTAGDLLNPWIDQYNEAVTNASQLANNFFLAPGVGSQQFLVDASQLLQEVFADPSKLGDVTQQLQDDLTTVSQSLTLIGAPDDLRADVINQTMDGGAASGNHQFIYDTLFNFIPADQPLLEVANEFLGSPLSGILIGELGPYLAPWVALGNSITDGDSLNEILANMVGAYFNGATLNLDSVAPLLVSSGILVLPPGTTVNHLSLALGGLFSPGVVQNGPWDIYDSHGDTLFETPAVGGSMFSSLGLDLNSGPLAIDVAGNPVGPLAAWQGLSELVGLQLGSDWNGKTGSFAKIPAFPPGAGLEPPTIPDLPTSDVAGGAAATAATATQFDLGDEFSQLFTGVDQFFNDLF